MYFPIVSSSSIRLEGNIAILKISSSLTDDVYAACHRRRKNTKTSWVFPKIAVGPQIDFSLINHQFWWFSPYLEAPSWWFPPIWKNIRQNGFIFLKDRGENFEATT